MFAINYRLCHNFLAPISYLVCDLGLAANSGWGSPRGNKKGITYSDHDLAPETDLRLLVRSNSVVNRKVCVNKSSSLTCPS